VRARLNPSILNFSHISPTASHIAAVSVGDGGRRFLAQRTQRHPRGRKSGRSAFPEDCLPPVIVARQPHFQSQGLAGCHLGCVRITPVCVELMKLERKSIPGCSINGEALESLIFRASTSPEARQIIMQAAMKNPLFAAAHRTREADHAKGKSQK